MGRVYERYQPKQKVGVTLFQACPKVMHAQAAAFSGPWPILKVLDDNKLGGCVLCRTLRARRGAWQPSKAWCSSKSGYLEVGQACDALV